MAEDVWDRYNYDFGRDYSGLFQSLSHVNYNVRVAAAEALAALLDENPDTIQVNGNYVNYCNEAWGRRLSYKNLLFVYLFFQESLSTLFSLYIRDVGFGDNNIDAGWLGRQGIALALHSAADVLRTKDLPVVMTFLISRALVGILFQLVIGILFQN